MPEFLRYRMLPAVLAAMLLAVLASAASAEEIYLQNGKRMMAMVERVDASGKVTLRLPNGQMQDVDLRDIITITFRGREPRAIRAGAQEFLMVNGDRVMGQIVKMTPADTLEVHAPLVGDLEMPLKSIFGFLTMPVEGRSGRRATELVYGEEDEETGMMDQVLDRRTAGYEGVIEEVNSKELTLDHERMTKSVPLNILYLAGVRLARQTKDPRPALPREPFIKLHTRDNSALDGLIETVQHGRWNVHPRWQGDKLIPVRVEEITEVEVLNGYAIYLSQLLPEKVVEKTILAPMQRYRVNRNCLGNEMTIAGNNYAWGIGVHADSELTFDVSGSWSTFEAAIGIDDQMGDGGSVIYSVLGDGRQLYKSPVVRGADSAPLVIKVPIQGVKKLTLKVEATDDLDLGDAANWAACRLIR